MNLPSGEIVEENLDLKNIDISGLLKALVEKQFTGYVVDTIMGYAGVEEGALLFKRGELIGSFFEYTNFNIIVFGKDAVAQTFNSLAAPKGVVDIVSLSVQQADLVVAFNDRLKVTNVFKRNDLLGMIRRQYVTSFAQKTLSSVVGESESRKSVLKKFGLSELG
ncbi:MAG: hypothetical protein HYW50_05295 [Candidatus Diapherotrites archaeon]|nr:hypothetical protein [Candidatus Diapherotrites archaeon]